MAHCVVPEAESLLDRELKVLDRGFVRLVDYCGSDARIVQAARVSYGAGTKTVREDAALIDYLLRHRHTSPFEQVVFTFHLKMPIFVARQLVRHRTARLNEISGRYSVLQNEFYLPAAEDIALQSNDNKQGRQPESLPAEEAEKVRSALKSGQEQAYSAYAALVENGLARELARINLPLSVYTEMYWQIDLHNLLHFLALRLDSHAQKEIRVYAEAMLKAVKAVTPLAAASFENHQKNAVTFSASEMTELRARLRGEGGSLTGKALERLEEKLETGAQL